MVFLRGQIGPFRRPRASAIALISGVVAALVACSNGHVDGWLPSTNGSDAGSGRGTDRHGDGSTWAPGEAGSAGDAGSGETGSGPTGAVYPLKVSADRRTLTDQSGRPYFLLADTAFMLPSAVTRVEAASYLDTRKSQGYNSVLVYLVNWNGLRFTSAQGKTAFEDGDAKKPNDAYFADVDDLLRDAADRGMMLFASPFELDNAIKAGLSTADWTSYCTYLAKRYKSFPNLVWMVGGDHDPKQSWTDNVDYTPQIEACVDAIVANDTSHLISYHPATATSEFFSEETWLSFNTIQRNLADDNPFSYELVQHDYDLNPVKGTLDIEPAYETADAMSDVATTPYMVRRNGYWAKLSGALGVVYGGNSATWNISSSSGWKEELALPGALQIGYLRKILEAVPSWQELVPDSSHRVVTSGYGTFKEKDYVTAARTPAGAAVVAYVPTSRTITVDMSALSGAAHATWYDPSDGTSASAGTSLAASGSKSFKTPGANHAGDGDYVLVVSVP
jgi:hypothetical protein